MKPIRLEMTAFGSYGQKTVIDFTRLPDDIYLITGDTGAGKTTIFDAIVFALFAETSGEDRTKYMMHSDFVPKSTPTEVVLEFEHNGVRSIVKRTIRYTRSQATGEYYNPKIISLLNEGNKVPIENNVTERIVQIIGMDDKQFGKIVMLAQGEFNRFLISGTDEKSKILAKLFDSSQFVSMQNRLDQASSKLEAVRKGDLEKRRAIMDETFILPEGINEEDVKLYNSNHPDLVKNLEALVSEDKSKNEALLNEKEEKDNYSTELGNRRAIALEHNRKFEELEKENLKKAELEKEKNAIEELKVRTGHITSAWRIIRPEVNSLSEKNNNLQENIRTVEVLSDGEKELKTKVNECQRTVDGDESRKNRSNEIGAEITLLSDSISSYENLEKYTEDLREYNNELTAAEEKCEEKSKELESIISGQEKTRSKLKNLENIESDLTRAESVLNDAQGLVDKITGKNGLVSDVNELKELEKELEGQKNKILESNGRVRQLFDEFRDINQRYLDGQAAVLARELGRELHEKGKAVCPVCHTALNESHEAELAEVNCSVPEKHEVESAEASYNEANRKYQELDNRKTGLETDIKNKTQNIERKVLELFSEAETWEHIKSEAYIEAKIGNAERDLESKNELKKAFQLQKEEKTKLQQKETDDDQKKQSLETEIADLKDRIGAVKQNIAGTESAINELKAKLKYLSKAEALKKLAELNGEKQELDKSIDGNLKALEAAKNELSRITGSLEQARERQPELKKQVETAEKKQQEAFAKTEIKDMDEYNKTIQMLDGNDGENWISEQQQRINDYAKAVDINNQTLENLKNETADWEIVDIDELDAAIAEAKEKKAEAEQVFMAFNKVYENHNQTLETIRDINEKLEETRAASERLKVLGSIAVASGNSDDGRLSFERYALGAIFREILKQANNRLETMTSGKYELKHTVAGKQRNSQAGFEIEVLDRTNDGLRTPGSFSGGEKFLVSMALALGLSDVVQSRSGGCSIDAMFIDEGFGTLSGNVLELAIDVLKQLSGNKRQVGIISHVSALEECIPNKIEVKCGENGSTAVIK